MAKKPNHRQVAMVDAPSFENAIDLISELTTLGNVHCMDMTRDFNQNKWLGQELNNVLLFFNENTSLNSLLAILGCIRAPHLVILSCDRNQIKGYFKKHILLPGFDEIAQPLTPIHYAPPVTPTLVDCEQHLAILLEKLRQSSIVHLVGERGAGKSTLLGCFIAQEIIHKKIKVVLSAPMRSASKNTLKVFSTMCIDDVSRETLTFVPPEKLMNTLCYSDLIVIDEAATYPKGILEKALKHAKSHGKQMILSTTIEGYEGTGQSYRLNYLEYAVTTMAASKNTLYLDSPMRFSADDPLYQLCQSFNHTCTKISSIDYQHSGLFFLTTATLRKRGWTNACFALLREAHYKTTPNDLEGFYNRSAYFVVMLEYGKLIAAAYVLDERLSKGTCALDLLRGVRRAKNALTHQALIHAYGLSQIEEKGSIKKFAEMHILRVARIAVAKPHRRKRIATQLIKTLESKAKKRNYDMVSTSFSGSSTNISYWQSQGFSLARVGLYPNKFNNEYALLMIKSLSESSKTIENNCHQLVRRHLHYFSLNYPSDYLAMCTDGAVNEISTVDQLAILESITSVVNYHRNINWLLPSLANWLEKSNLQNNMSELLDGTMRDTSARDKDVVYLNKFITMLSL